MSPNQHLDYDENDPRGATWTEYRFLVLAELERLNRTIKEEVTGMRVILDQRVMELKSDSIAVLREDQARGQLDRLKLWEELRKTQEQISKWKGGFGVLIFVLGGIISAVVTFFINHLWK